MRRMNQYWKRGFCAAFALLFALFMAYMPQKAYAQDGTPDDSSAEEDGISALVALPTQTLPLDVLIDDGSGTTFINGPRDVQIGDKVYGKFTINMESIAKIVDLYGNSTGLITGEFSMKIKGSEGIAPSSGAALSSDINDYFAGEAVQLFELTGAPSYDEASNTLTYNAKVVDKLGTDGIVGTELARILRAGLYAVSTNNNTAVVNDGIITPEFARLSDSFGGTLTFTNVSKTQSYTISMVGVQDDPDNLADPTLSEYGDDPATLISATVLYKAPTPTSVDLSVEKAVTGDPSTPGNFTFVLTAADKDNPMPDSSEGVKEVSQSGAGTADFGTIQFTEAGKYVYTVTEKNSGEDGYTYDGRTYTVTYEVTNQDGALAADRVITDESGTQYSNLTFSNSYTAASTGTTTATTATSGTAVSSTVKASPASTGDASDTMMLWLLLLMSFAGVTAAAVKEGRA